MVILRKVPVSFNITVNDRSFPKSAYEEICEVMGMTSYV